MPKGTVVYLIVHELFGILSNTDSLSLVTPVVKSEMCDGSKMRDHTYKIARFKNGKWQAAVPMLHGEVYRLQGVKQRTSTATHIPCHPEFSPTPPGTFALNPLRKPFCQWDLYFPRLIHQLRMVSIPESSRPVFVGDPHGDAIEAQLNTISLVHAFEYEHMDGEDVAILDKDDNILPLDYDADTKTNTVNLHLWAQLEDESGMSDCDADEHAAAATAAMVALFKDMALGGTHSLSIDDIYQTQARMPAGIAFIELLTLAEIFALKEGRFEENLFCTHKTCGYGGNLYVNVKRLDR